MTSLTVNASISYYVLNLLVLCKLNNCWLFVTNEMWTLVSGRREKIGNQVCLNGTVAKQIKASLKMKYLTRVLLVNKLNVKSTSSGNTMPKSTTDKPTLQCWIVTLLLTNMIVTATDKITSTVWTPQGCRLLPCFGLCKTSYQWKYYFGLAVLYFIISLVPESTCPTQSSPLFFSKEGVFKVWTPSNRHVIVSITVVVCSMAVQAQQLLQPTLLKRVNFLLLECLLFLF